MRAARFAIPCSTPPVLPAVTVVGGLLIGMAGCTRQGLVAPQRLEGPPPQMEIGWSESALRGGGGGAAPVAIREGGAPLVYLSDMAATYRVVERTGGGGGDRFLAQGAVAPRTIVRVDERSGVVFGRQTLLPGPLPEGRRYAILMVPEGESVSRTGVSQPVKEAPPDLETQTIVDPTRDGGSESGEGPDPRE